MAEAKPPDGENIARMGRCGGCNRGYVWKRAWPALSVKNMHCPICDGRRRLQQTTHTRPGLDWYTLDGQQHPKLQGLPLLEVDDTRRLPGVILLRRFILQGGTRD